ncbi:MAG: transcriptional repressor [Chitinophagaceae bacterium]|nr:transcriptional repressor [Chitinophagaceae bacterium]
MASRLSHIAKISDFLRKHKLSVTESRKQILKLFIEQPGALAHADIEKKTGERFDRVTIYRTLQTFLEKGIIHSIPTSDNSVLYALCKENCSEGRHVDHHIHFICTICQNTYCLDETNTPDIKLPKGYRLNRLEVVAEGTCKNCI